jgi:hypothetical protein
MHVECNKANHGSKNCPSTNDLHVGCRSSGQYKLRSTSWTNITGVTELIHDFGSKKVEKIAFDEARGCFYVVSTFYAMSLLGSS